MRRRRNAKSNRTIILLVALCLFSGASTGASFADKPLTYQMRNNAGAIVPITMPFIVTEDKAVAERINTFLHQFFLNILPPIPGADAATPRVIELGLESMKSAGAKRMNRGRTLSVFVEQEGCGAYCTNIDIQVDFDTRTGRVLTEQEIVTPQGILALGVIAAKTHAMRLRREILRLKKLGDRRTKRRSTDEISAQIDLYERCLGERYTKDRSAYEYRLQDPGVMVIRNGSLLSDSGECFGHAACALDDLGTLSLELAGERLRPYLTAYGKYLLLGEGDGAMPAINPYAQIFHGKINNAIAVTVYLGKALESPRYAPYSGARYTYNLDGTFIDLRQNQIGDVVELVTSENGILRFRISGKKLVGLWQGGGKTYPFEAAP